MSAEPGPCICGDDYAHRHLSHEELSSGECPVHGESCICGVNHRAVYEHDQLHADAEEYGRDLHITPHPVYLTGIAQHLADVFHPTTPDSTGPYSDPSEWYDDDPGSNEELYVADVVREASEAFWNVVAARFPDAKTGDYPPDADNVLRVALERAIRLWVTINVPEEVSR